MLICRAGGLLRVLGWLLGLAGARGCLLHGWLFWLIGLGGCLG